MHIAHIRYLKTSLNETSGVRYVKHIILFHFYLIFLGTCFKKTHQQNVVSWKMAIRCHCEGDLQSLALSSSVFSE